jgi:hypothetical protein
MLSAAVAAVLHFHLHRPTSKQMGALTAKYPKQYHSDSNMFDDSLKSFGSVRRPQHK